MFSCDQYESMTIDFSRFLDLRAHDDRQSCVLRYAII